MRRLSVTSINCKQLIHFNGLKSKRTPKKKMDNIGSSQSNKFTKVTMVPAIAGRAAAAHAPAAADAEVAEAARDLR